MKGLEEKVTFNLCDSILVRILGEAHSEWLDQRLRNPRWTWRTQSE